MLSVQVVILAVLIILSAFFSGVETAFMSIGMAKVKTLLNQKKRGAEALYRLKHNPNRLIVTILIGNNLVNIGAASFATVLFTNLFGSSGVGVATGVMTFLILVFGEITPKTFAAQNAEKVSLVVAWPIEILSIILSPLVWLFGAVARLVLKLTGSKKEKSLSEEELKTLVTMGYEEGILNRETADMMHNILKFEGSTVAQVMTPEASVEMVDGAKRLKDVIDFVVKTPFSRYPVYIGERNNVVGVLDVDDVLAYTKNHKLGVKVKSITRPVNFVPESKEIDDLLVELEGKSVPLVLVVDEHKSVVGLVTVEDILEEIVGDIFDKSKREKVYLKKVSDKLIRADARASIEEVNRVLHLGLKGQNFDTLAGFIQHRLQRIPKKGEKLQLKRVTIEIAKVTPRGVTSVNIHKS